MIALNTLSLIVYASVLLLGLTDDEISLCDDIQIFDPGKSIIFKLRVFFLQFGLANKSVVA